MLSKNIKKLRTEKGMTQKELAEKPHVTQNDYPVQADGSDGKLYFYDGTKVKAL